MKTFPAGFTAEKNKKTGSLPIWILRITANAVDYWISDGVYTIPSGGAGWPPTAPITTLTWVAAWGAIRESIGGGIGEILIADITVTMLTDQSIGNNIEYLATTTELEKNPCELYLWFYGLNAVTDPPQVMFSGNISDLDIPDETQVTVTIEDEAARLQQYLGNRISKEAYPLCDPDVVGKMIPVVFGPVPKLPALCVDSGWVSSLPLGLDGTSNTMVVSEIPAYSLANKLVWVEEEIVLVSAQAGKTLTIVRGQSSTPAVAHIKGTVVVEKKPAGAPLVYLVADHAVDAIGTILARVRGVNVDITADVTKYLGTVGNQLAAYPGKAAFTVQDYARVSQKIVLALAGDVSVSAGSHTHAAGTLAVTNSAPWSWTMAPSPQNLTASYNMYGIPGNGQWTYYYGKLTINFPVPPANILTRTITFTINCSFAAGPIQVQVLNVGYLDAYTPGSGAKSYSFTYNPSYLSAAAYGGAIVTLWVPCFYMLLPIGQMYQYNYTSSYVVSVSAVTDNGTYNTTSSSNVNISAANTPLTVLNTLGLSGNSVADIYLGDQILADVTRNITAPAAVISNVLTTYCGLTAVTQVGTLPAHFRLVGAITEYKRAIEWLDYLAWQCGCYFRRICGVSKLIVRIPGLVSQKDIPACIVNDEGVKMVKRKKAPITDVVNTINLFYGRDWSSSNKQAESYTQTLFGDDPVSVANYGELERPEQFMFDFVVDSQMAASLVTLFLGLFSARPWRTTFSTYLDHCELEFADVVTLGFANFLVGQIVEAALTPGDVDTIDSIEFTVLSPTIPQEPAKALITHAGNPLITQSRRFLTYG